MLAPTAVPTPDRKTIVRFNEPDFQIVRPAWKLTKLAHQVTHVKLPGQPSNTNLYQYPSGLIGLNPFQMMAFAYLYTEFKQFVVGAPDVNLAGNWSATNSYRPPTDLPGVSPNAGTSAGQVQAGGNIFSQNVPQGSTFGLELGADAGAFSKPPRPDDEPPEIIYQSRFLQGKVTYPENTGFSLFFHTGKKPFGNDDLLTFYMGGRAPTYPSTARGGEFAIRISGSGYARVFERVAGSGTDQWKERCRFRWTVPGNPMGQNQWHTIGFLPLANDRFHWLTNMSDVEFANGSGLLGNLLNAFTTVSGFLTQGTFSQNEWIDTWPQTGHRHIGVLTGPGIVRMDARRDWKQPLSISKIFFPPTGFLTDAPFSIPFDLPAGTPIIFSGTLHALRDAHVNVNMYDASTHLPLTHDINGNFLSVAGQRNYYIGLDFYASSDGLNSPLLIDYTVAVGPSVSFPSPTALEGGAVQRVNISGQDITSDHETASTTIRDPADTLGATLRNKSRVWSSIYVLRPSDDTILTKLFKGEYARPEAQKKGRMPLPGGLSLFPSENWTDYNNLKFVGAWCRLADQRFVGLMDFRKSFDNAKDAEGKVLPWLVTDAIQFLLENAGYPANMIYVPPKALRFWYSPDLTNEGYQIVPAADYATILNKLCRDFLGQYLIYDTNAWYDDAPTDSMWRLLDNPQPPYDNVLHEFFTERPVGITTPRIMIAEEAYGVGKSWILQDSYFTDVEPPEFNYISVSTNGQLLPRQNGAMALGYIHTMVNYASLFDETSPDFLGRFVPLHVVEPYIGGGDPIQAQIAVNSLCFRLYDFAGHARKWCRFVAPLVLIWDPLDPFQKRARPLRINDVIKVDGQKAIIRSVNPDYESDYFQKANYKAVFIE